MIRIVVATQKTEEEYKQTVQYKCLENLQVKQIRNDISPGGWVSTEKITITICEKNTTGLSKLYNYYLSSEDILDDIIVFMHDDVEVHDQFFVEKLIKAHETYDIVGLAGATTQKYSRDKPTVWHHCKENPNDTRGIVAHYIPKGFNGVAENHYNSAYFGPTPAPVAVIDGLFMSVKGESLAGKNVTFDNDFDFHHYDMAFCVRAKKAGLNIGVWPIFVVHHGLGEFNTPEWKTSHTKFLSKYDHVQTHI